MAFSKRAAYKWSTVSLSALKHESHIEMVSVRHLGTHVDTQSGNENFTTTQQRQKSIIKKRKTLTYTVHEILKSQY